MVPPSPAAKTSVGPLPQTPYSRNAVVPPGGPDDIELARRPARLRRPAGPVVLEDRPVSAHGEDIAPTCAPDAHEHLRRPARLRGPRRPVEMVNLALVRYGEDIAPSV